jgi:xanthosine utilization system XapX-like protein
LTPSEDRTERLIHIAPYLSAAVLALVLLSGVILGPKIIETANTTKAQEQASSVATCRSGIRSDVDQATQQLLRVLARQNQLITSGLAASVTKDKARFKVITGQVPLRDRQLNVAVDSLAAANRRYRIKAVRLAGTDPDAFLAECRAR